MFLPNYDDNNPEDRAPIERLVASAIGLDLQADEDDAIIPSSTVELTEYYLQQGAWARSASIIDSVTEEVKDTFCVVDARHCRDVELNGLREHQKLLRVISENENFRAGFKAHYEEIENLKAENQELAGDLAQSRITSLSALTLCLVLVVLWATRCFSL